MYETLEQIARSEFGDLVSDVRRGGRRAGIILKIRLLIRDGTFVDVWLAPDSTRYSYHWEQRARRGLIHRHDNAPDHPDIATFPRHFHDGSEAGVRESHLPDEPRDALRFFLQFVRERLAALGE